MNGPRLYWLICCAAALAACNSAKSEWSKATTADTIPAYQAFLSKYPNDAHEIDAEARIVSLEQDRQRLDGKLDDLWREHTKLVNGLQ